MTTERYIVEENQHIKSRFQEFLQVCRNSGAHEKLDPRKRHLIEIYFGTNATLNDLRPFAGVTTREAVRQLIFSGIRSSWNNLTADLQSEYPLPNVIHSLHIVSLAKRERHSPEVRAKMSAAHKKYWQNQRQQT